MNRIITFSTTLGILYFLTCLGNLYSEDVLHYDLLPPWYPESGEFHRDLAQKYDDLNRFTQLNPKNTMEEFTIHFFRGDSIAMVGIFAQHDDSGLGNVDTYWLEYRYIESASGKNMNGYATAFPIPKDLKREYSRTWKDLLFRVSASSYADTLPRPKEWMLVSGDGLQGIAYLPFLESPLGKMLGITLVLLESGKDGTLEPELAKSLRMRVEEVGELVKPRDGKWKLQVSDPFEKIHDNTKIRRFKSNTFLYGQIKKRITEN